MAGRALTWIGFVAALTACTAANPGLQVGLGAVGTDLAAQPDGGGAAGDATVVNGLGAVDTSVPLDGGIACDVAACPKAPACFQAVCVATGCGQAPSPIGFQCDDGVACTKSDGCANGTCNGIAYTCSDGNPCTLDACDGSACSHPAAAAGTACDDGDSCTLPDRCSLGQCKGGPDSCASMLPPGIGASPCKLTGDLPKASAIQVVPWFTSLAVSQPIYLTHFPDDSDRIIVVSRPGQISLFVNDPAVTTKKLVLDIAPKVSTAGEGGLLSVAFHPEFKQNRKFYVNYTSTGQFKTVISEFTMKIADPEVADPASEKQLLSIIQPYSNHNGGQINFDVDGFLLIGMGDGGSSGDPLNTGQDTLNLLGKMLRIDVDKPASGKGYGIPQDNPFVGNAAYAPEIFALGMRNPWRFSIDRVTGTIWAGDVGQNLWEEVDIIEKGKNYGWRKLEGTHCYNPSTGCITAGMTMPVAELPHGQSNSINGGYVYRGSQNPALYGAYLFNDYSTGKYWSLTPNGPGTYALKELLDTADAPVSFGEDRDGELYVTQLFPPKIWKIVQQTVVPPAGTVLPSKLSQTGCFAQLQPLVPATGVVPYEVNVPLWSDGAHKSRYVVLPPGPAPKLSAVGPLVVADDATQSWSVPTGTLLIKHFAVGDSKTPVETRFMRRDADGWKFFTYRWNKAGTDADFWPGGGSAAYPIKSVDSGATQTWTMPSLGQCAMCHKGPSQDSQLLGVQTAQLDRVAAWTKGQNQVKVFAKGGLLSKPGIDLEASAPFPSLTALDTGGAVPQQGSAARAYLHANCAHCHRPGGDSPSDLDLRFTTGLAKTHACGQPPQAGKLGVADAQIVLPGVPQKSTLWLRMTQTAQSGWLMPQVGVSVPHVAGAKLVADWITGLASCAGP